MRTLRRYMRGWTAKDGTSERKGDKRSLKISKRGKEKVAQGLSI